MLSIRSGSTASNERGQNLETKKQKKNYQAHIVADFFYRMNYNLHSPQTKIILQTDF